MQTLLWAVGGAGFPFLMTALGAAVVFFFRERISSNIQRIFLGFAAGVMIAASVWSLLIPAIEETEQAGGVGWLPASGGFLLGILLMLLLDGLLPRSLTPVIAETAGVAAETAVSQVSRAQREKLMDALKGLPVHAAGFRPIAEAIVTRGGVSVKEVDPKTMQSKLCPGLYFAGEVLDVDAYTGGYNLGIAFATAYAAASHL